MAVKKSEKFKKIFVSTFSLFYFLLTPPQLLNRKRMFRNVLQGFGKGIGFRSIATVQKRWKGQLDRSQNKGAGFSVQKKTLGNRSEKAAFPIKIRNAGVFIHLGDMRMNPLWSSCSFARTAESPFYQFNKPHYPHLLGQLRQKAIVKKIVIRSPRRPNSGKPLCAEVSIRKPSIRTGEPVATTVCFFYLMVYLFLRELTFVLS